MTSAKGRTERKEKAEEDKKLKNRGRNGLDVFQANFSHKYNIERIEILVYEILSDKSSIQSLCAVPSAESVALYVGPVQVVK